MSNLRDLEAAISRHLENERRYINPLFSEAHMNNIKIHIKTIQDAPRNYAELCKLVKQREEAIDRATDSWDVDIFDAEREALDRLRGIVQAYELGRNLETIAY